MDNVGRYAKAIAALVSSVALLVGGDALSSQIDVEELEVAIIAVVNAAAVFVVRNDPA